MRESLLLCVLSFPNLRYITYIPAVKLMICSRYERSSRRVVESLTRIHILLMVFPPSPSPSFLIHSHLFMSCYAISAQNGSHRICPSQCSTREEVTNTRCAFLRVLLPYRATAIDFYRYLPFLHVLLVSSLSGHFHFFRDHCFKW